MTHFPLRSLIVLSAGAAIFAKILLCGELRVEKSFLESSRPELGQLR